MSEEKINEAIDAMREEDTEKAQSALREAVQGEIKKFFLNEEEEENEDGVDYDTVYYAVADYMNVDPEKIDELSEKKKKKFYETIDKCWDEEENKVPDACPVDIPVKK